MKQECYVLAGGPSLKDFDYSKLEGKDVITINKSFFSYPKAKYFITMDHSFLTKHSKINKQLKNSKATKIFIANFCFPFMEEKDGRIVDTRWNIIYKLNAFDVIIKSYYREHFGFELNEFHNGQNSGYCAVQLAILLGYKEINLLGIDLNVTDKTHHHEGYGEAMERFTPKLAEYYDYFKRAILDLQEKETDIEIYSCSKISKLNKFLKYREL